MNKTYTLIASQMPSSNPFHFSHTRQTEKGLEMYDGSQLLGYIPDNPVSMLPGTEKADSVLGDGNAFIMMKQKNDLLFLMIDLFPSDIEGKKDNKQPAGKQKPEYLLFGGSQVLYSKKKDLWSKLESEGSVAVRMIMDEGKVVVLTESGEQAGVMVDGQQIPSAFAMQTIVNGVAMPLTEENAGMFENLPRTRGQYIVEVGKEINHEHSDFSDLIKSLNESCIDHPENVRKKIKFMQESMIPDKMIREVLSSYRSYAAADRFKIKEPPYPYMDGSSHYLMRIIAYVLAGENVRLVGDKGCGKNTLLNTLSWLFNKPLFKIGCSERTDEYTIFGSTQVKNGNTMHRLSPFAHGLTIGAICILDEANMVPAELMSVINQITDDTREVDINNYGLLKVHPDTRVFMTMNEEYEGVVALNDATADRFQGVIMESEMDIGQLLRYLVPDAKKEDIETCTMVFNKIKEQVKEQDVLTPSAITIRGYQAALLAAKYLPLQQCLEDSIAGRLQSPEEREIVRTTIAAFAAK